MPEMTCHQMKMLELTPIEAVVKTLNPVGTLGEALSIHVEARRLELAEKQIRRETKLRLEHEKAKTQVAIAAIDECRKIISARLDAWRKGVMASAEVRRELILEIGRAVVRLEYCPVEGVRGEILTAISAISDLVGKNTQKMKGVLDVTNRRVLNLSRPGRHSHAD